MYPDRVREQIYENLVADPENEIRELLDYCELPFEEACLNFHETERRVSTPSASQVREKIRKDTARTDKYGALLDPLRAALGMPPFARMNAADPNVRAHLEASERALRAATSRPRYATRAKPRDSGARSRRYAAPTRRCLTALGPSAEAVDAIERAVAAASGRCRADHAARDRARSQRPSARCARGVSTRR